VDRGRRCRWFTGKKPATPSGGSKKRRDGEGGEGGEGRTTTTGKAPQGSERARGGKLWEWGGGGGESSWTESAMRGPGKTILPSGSKKVQSKYRVKLGDLSRRHRPRFAYRVRKHEEGGTCRTGESEAANPLIKRLTARGPLGGGGTCARTSGGQNDLDRFSVMGPGVNRDKTQGERPVGRAANQCSGLRVAIASMQWGDQTSGRRPTTGRAEFYLEHNSHNP